jgi:hypothetical protein
MKASIDNIYNDTQFIRNNMVTLSAIQDLNNSIWWLRNNSVNTSVFGSNMSNIMTRLGEINTTTQTIKTTVDCSNPTNSALCMYLNTTNNTANYIMQNMATYAQVLNVSNNTQWLINNVATQTTIQNNLTDIINRITNINSTIQNIQTTINCSSPTNSALCTYLNTTNSTANYISQNMATYAQVLNISNNTQWLIDNVATQTTIQNNFTDIISKILSMNSSLAQSITQLNTSLNGVDSGLVSQILDVQNNLTWITNNVATSAEIDSNFTETFNRLNNINSTLFGIQGYIYTNITGSLNNLNNTVSSTQNYIYTNITGSLNIINSTLGSALNYILANTSTQSNMTYLLSQITILQDSLQNYSNYILANMSTQANITYLLNQISDLQNDTIFIKNNMFYQGNATGNFLADYVSSVYTLPGDKAELWIATNDLLGNPKTVVSADCSIMKEGSYVSTANVTINPGGVHAYWNIGINQTAGAYYWNCTLTGSILNIEVPFYVSSISVAQSSFQISSLVAGSPRYPNEEALVEAVFSTNSGVPVDPDDINVTIYDKNNNAWASANKSAFTKGPDNIWSYSHSIESNPTTGMYTVHLTASYSGIEDSKSVQFRIATGGPYKVYLDCPTSTNVGQILYCNVILQDEGEVGTESTSTIWVDTNNNGVVDDGEPQIAFSKKTTPLQNVTQQVSINVPSTQPTGLYVVRVNTSYTGSSQPESQASASVVFNPEIIAAPSNGSAGSDGGASGLIVLNTNNTNATTPASNGGAGGASSNNTLLVQTKGVVGLSTKTIEGYTNVHVGDKIMEEIDLYNLGNEPIRDGTLTYCIIDGAYENITPCNQEKVSFDTRTQLLKKIILPQYVHDGTYFFYVKFDYNNDTVDSKDDFKVASQGSMSLGLLFGSADLASISLLILILIIFIILILLIIIILVTRRSGTTYVRSEREDAKDKDDKAMAAQIEEEMRIHLKNSDLAAYKVYADAEREDMKIEIERLKEKIANKNTPPKNAPPLKFDEPEDKSKLDVKPDAGKHIMFRDVDDRQAFYFCNGEKARNIVEFTKIIRNLSEEQFLHHVNYQKNDFAKWCGEIFGYYEMAQMLTLAPNKESVLKVLESYKVDM